MKHDAGDQVRIPAVFMRGGTSKALIFKETDLPPQPSARRGLFLAAMGSPDPGGRQLDGMGGGISSLSKVCIVGPPSRADADVDYTFVQVGVREPVVDMNGNCGNMSSAIGPFAVDEKLAPAPNEGPVTVRIHNTNTGKIIHSHFQIRNGVAAVNGDTKITGVAGQGSGIRLDFMDPGGSKGRGLLPTGRPVDKLDFPGGRVTASLVDSANACVFVKASDLEMSALESPDFLDASPDILDALEKIRCAASVAMGMTPDVEAAARIRSIPKVAVIGPPGNYRDLSGIAVPQSDYDVSVRMISMGQPHRAVPLTGAMCAASAARIPGTVIHDCLRGDSNVIRIGAPSGVLMVEAEVRSQENRLPEVIRASVWRTARRLMEGFVMIPKKTLEVEF